MLGLSSGLMYSSAILDPTLVFDFTFDFTSSASVLWEKIAAPNPTDFVGDMTIELGENAPGESTNNWMKCTYDSDQTAVTGIRVPNIQTIGFSGGKINDRAVVTYKIYLDGDWDGSDDVNYWRDEVYSKTIGDAIRPIAQDEIVDVVSSSLESATAKAGFNNWDSITATKKIVMTNGHSAYVSDRPNAGAIFYIKDYNIKIYR